MSLQLDHSLARVLALAFALSLKLHSIFNPLSLYVPLYISLISITASLSPHIYNRLSLFFSLCLSLSVSLSLSLSFSFSLTRSLSLSLYLPPSRYLSLSFSLYLSLSLYRFPICAQTHHTDTSTWIFQFIHQETVYVCLVLTHEAGCTALNIILMVYWRFKICWIIIGLLKIHIRNKSAQTSVLGRKC